MEAFIAALVAAIVISIGGGDASVVDPADFYCPPYGGHCEVIPGTDTSNELWNVYNNRPVRQPGTVIDAVNPYDAPAYETADNALNHLWATGGAIEQQ